MENNTPMLAKAQKSTVSAGLTITVPDLEAPRRSFPVCGLCHAPYVGFGHVCPNCLAPRPPVVLQAAA